MKNLAIYIHWPFCKSKCPYCDFNSHVRAQFNHHEWMAAYLKEIEYYSHIIANRNITSIFFGGGTPSLMPVSIVASILEKLSFLSNFDPNIEITLEANPTSVETEKFADLAKAGINRVSIGIQSFNEESLKFLGREHSANEAFQALEIANKHFLNFSFDLIYALPNQSILQWEKELTSAIKFAKYHISLYQLTIEKGTRFYSDYTNNKFTLPSNDEAAILYEITEKVTAQHGFNCYEISNYAKPKYESNHNLAYWQYDEYLGPGAGAHSRVNRGNGIEALMNFHLPEKWLKDIQEKGFSLQNQTLLRNQEIAEEYILMNLRLERGLYKNSFQEKTNIDFDKFIEKKKLLILEKDGFLINNNDKVQLTFKGKLLLNQIIKFLL